MPEPVTPDHYDAETAAAMTTLAGQLDGLPTYLGIRTTHVGPAVMTAELDVRPELLNPFGTLHGGVLSALVDHVLGAVLYPPGPPSCRSPAAPPSSKSKSTTTADPAASPKAPC